MPTTAVIWPRLCCVPRFGKLTIAHPAPQAMLLMQKAKTYLKEAEVRRQSPWF